MRNIVLTVFGYITFTIFAGMLVFASIGGGPFYFLMLCTFLILPIYLTYCRVKFATTSLYYTTDISVFTILAGILLLLNVQMHEAPGTIIFILASIPYLLFNIVSYHLFRYYGDKGFKAAIILAIIICIYPIYFGFDKSLNYSKLQDLDKNLPMQFIYKYNNNLFYYTSDKKAIYKMTGNGDIHKITDADIEYDFFSAYGSKIYYNDDGKGKELNLDSEVIKILPKRIGNGGYVFNQSRYIFGKDEPLISKALVIGDGFAYFSTENGLYRLKVNDNRPIQIVKGDITLFNIKEGYIYYYDTDSAKVKKTPYLKPF